MIGIEQNRRVPHYKVEQYLRASTLRWTFLRASFFMQNLSGTHRAEIRERGELYVPVGRGKTSFLDVRDIGAVAAAALTQAGHDNTAYDLTGPAALDYYEVAAIFSQVLGRPIVYRNPSVPAFLWRTLRGGTALPFALVMAYLYIQTRPRDVGVCNRRGRAPAGPAADHPAPVRDRLSAGLAAVKQG